MPQAARVADRAYEALHHRIVTLDIPPGATVRENVLMDELHVGRTPLREALKRLELEHLIRIRPRRATIVSPVEVHDIAHVGEVRAVLEAEAARLAASRLDGRTREDAEALAGELAHPGSPNAVQLMSWDERVHRLLWRAAGNPYLETTLAGYFSLSIRVGFLVLRAAPSLAASILDERDLLDAVLDGDEQRSRALMDAHVRAFAAEAIAALS